MEMSVDKPEVEILHMPATDHIDKVLSGTHQS
jgi:hypothetical protein